MSAPCTLHAPVPSLSAQAMSLGITPVIGFGVASALRPSGMSAALVDGIVVSASMPTTGGCGSVEAWKCVKVWGGMHTEAEPAV
eukprot:285786-Chlamydomonas_euryale.AAC.2